MGKENGSYECKNGFIGLNRDVIMRLLKLIGRDIHVVLADRKISSVCKCHSSVIFNYLLILYR